MNIQTTSDLQIITERSKNKIFNKYPDIYIDFDREKLISGKIIDINGKFFETEKILIIYRLANDEIRRYCRISMPGYKNIKPDEIEEGLFEFKLNFDEYPGYCDVFLNNKTKEGKNRVIKLRFDVLSKFDTEGNNILNRIYMVSHLRKLCIDIYKQISPARIPEYRIGLESSSTKEQYSFIDNIVNRLDDIIYQIHFNPDKELTKVKRKVKIWSVKNINCNMIKDMIDTSVQGCNLISVENEYVKNHLKYLPMDKNGNKFISDTVTIHKNITKSYDVISNRMLKGFLIILPECIERFKIKCEEEKYKGKYIEEFDQLIDRCGQLHKNLKDLSSYTFLNGVHELEKMGEIIENMYFLQKGNYIGIYDIIEEFIKSSVFDYSSKDLCPPLNKLWILYENWVTMLIVKILVDFGKKENLDVTCYAIDDTGYSRLDDMREDAKRKRKKGILLVKLIGVDKEIYLFYKKGYHKRSGGNMFPDLALDVRRGKNSKLLILDPKYRSTLKAGEEGNPENPKNKMHVYSDAIIRDGEYIVEAAYAIYLGGNDVHSLLKNKKDIIGARRLLPKENNIEDIEKIKEIIINFIDSEERIENRV